MVANIRTGFAVIISGNPEDGYFLLPTAVKLLYENVNYRGRGKTRIVMTKTYP